MNNSCPTQLNGVVTTTRPVTAPIARITQRRPGISRAGVSHWSASRMPLPTLTWVARQSMARRKSRIGQKSRFSASATPLQSQRIAQPRPAHRPLTGRSNQGRKARCGEGGSTKQRHSHIHQGAPGSISNQTRSHPSTWWAVACTPVRSGGGVGVVMLEGG